VSHLIVGAGRRSFTEVMVGETWLNDNGRPSRTAVSRRRARPVLDSGGPNEAHQAIE